ncbi:hypothetical protein ACFQX7_24105 [Luedemannella flava]
MRLVWFAVVWALMEAMALLACLGMWVSSGFGGRIRSTLYQERHYALMGWFLARIFAIATKVFDLRVEIDEPEHTPDELRARLARPVIVLSRHAGPGDSFLLVHHLLNLYQRRPRIVMKAALQLDPSIDVVINRLPHAFVRPRHAGVAPNVDEDAGAGADSGHVRESAVLGRSGGSRPGSAPTARWSSSPRVGTSPGPGGSSASSAWSSADATPTRGGPAA